MADNAWTRNCIDIEVGMFPDKKRITLRILLLLLFSISGYSSSQMEPAGQILGGSLNAPVRIEVFSNFECSHCREFYLRTVKKILKEYSSVDKVCVIYHDFPFSTHKYDRKAARYAEAASRIGKDTMLNVYDALYTDQAEWSQTGELEKSLQKALPKEDLDKIMEIAKDPGIDPLIEKQYELAIKNGLKSTPTIYVISPGKEQKVEGMLEYFVLKSFIDRIVK